MNFNKETIEGLRGIKITVEKDSKIVGRVYLYLINNDLHEKAYGVLEDLYVDEEYRNKGIGQQLVEAVIAEAKKQNCYKLISQSRYSRLNVHNFYKKNGFKDYGKNFRMDLLE